MSHETCTAPAGRKEIGCKVSDDLDFGQFGFVACNTEFEHNHETGEDDKFLPLADGVTDTPSSTVSYLNLKSLRLRPRNNVQTTDTCRCRRADPLAVSFGRPTARGALRVTRLTFLISWDLVTVVSARTALRAAGDHDASDGTEAERGTAGRVCLVHQAAAGGGGGQGVAPRRVLADGLHGHRGRYGRRRRVGFVLSFWQ